MHDIAAPVAEVDRPPPADPTAGLRVGVVVSRFPKFTETFVVNEIVALERLGLEIEIFPLLAEQRGQRQPAADALVARAHFGRPWGLRAVTAFVRTAAAEPRQLSRIMARLVRDTWRHPPFLVKDLLLLPRICVIAAELEALQVSHVHAHFATHAGFAAWALGRLTGLPYSIVAHGSDVHRNRAMLRTKIAESAFVATISDFNRAVILDECGPELADRVEVVRCGVDAATIVPSDRPMPQGEASIACVGTLHEVKGQRYAIEAVALLARRGRRVSLHLLGDGPDRTALEQLSHSLGVNHRVHFAGAVPHDQVISRYRQMDLLLAPSVPSRDGRREGIPTVIMEAMAAGLPVVASDLSGIPEIIEHDRTGLLVEPGRVEAIADAIDRLLTEPELAQRLGRAGRTRVLDSYEIGRTAGAMAELIAGARRGPRPS